jgi:hypothetical protein
VNRPCVTSASPSIGREPQRRVQTYQCGLHEEESERLSTAGHA